VRFAACDITAPWPAADGSVDIVVGNLVLEHVDDLSPVFTSAARVRRSRGTLYLCELHPFRQLRGGQAHFVDAETGDTTRVPAFPHSVSQYVNGGLAVGLSLVGIGEWHDEQADADALPRLLSVRFRQP
jgi:malonyl-CoA O-methyltransferase